MVQLLSAVKFTNLNGMDTMSKEVYSQLASYAEEPSGTTIMLYVVVLIGLVTIVYTLHSLAARSQLWTIQTFLLLEMLTVYFLLMPISALHPYIILVKEEFCILSHSFMQKYGVVKSFTYIYYNTFIYTFVTVLMLNLAHLLTQGQLKGQSRALEPAKKVLLCLLNIPITIVVSGAFTYHFTTVVESETANPDLPAFVTINIADVLFTPVIGVFCAVILLYMLFSYWLHKKMERVLYSSTFEEKSRELLYLEIQVMFGSFYGVFPCIILVTSLLIKSTQSRMVVSELITFCYAVQPILCCLLILAGHRALNWPHFVRKVLKKEQDSRQWATPRQTSVSLG